MIDSNRIHDSKCQVKLNLMSQIRTVTDLVDAIRNKQLAAAAQGHGITAESDSERLREAMQRETSLVEMPGQHVHVHGCKGSRLRDQQRRNELRVSLGERNGKA